MREIGRVSRYEFIEWRTDWKVGGVGPRGSGESGCAGKPEAGRGLGGEEVKGAEISDGNEGSPHDDDGGEE